MQPVVIRSIACCLFAVWLPGVFLLGLEAWSAQAAWTLWCAACATALVWRLRGDAEPRASAPDPVRDIAEGIPLAICICALPDGEILFANDAMSDLTGVLRASLSGRSLGEFCAEAQDRVRLEQALRDGRAFDAVELPARRDDGAVRWVSVSGRPDLFGARPALFVVCHDVTGQKQAQRSLVASEQRFRVLLGALSEAVVLYDAEARMLTSNRAAESCSWLEAAHAGLPGARMDRKLCDEQGRPLPHSRHPVMLSLSCGQPAHDVVMGAEDAGGQIRWLNVNTQPLFHAGASRPYAVVASYWDLTARIRAERALRASEQRYALALRGMNEGLIEWVAGGDALYASPRLLQIMGHDAGGRRIRVKDFIAGIHPDDKPAWSAVLFDLMRGRSEHFQQELRMRHADGSHHWFMLRGAMQRDARGRARRVVATVADISVRRRLEQADVAERELLSLVAGGVPLRQVMARLAMLIEGLLDTEARVAVLVFDGARDKVVDVSGPGLSESFRAGMGELAGDMVAELVRDGAGPVMYDDVASVEALKPCRALLSSEGVRALWMLPLAGRGGAALGYLAVYHRQPWRPGRSDEDVVERLADIAHLALERERGAREVRELHESLERRVAERTAMLEQANRELEAFSYSVSHDLRSPLRAINGFAHLLAEHAEASLDEEGRDMLGRIERGATRMGQLIDDILHFSRVSRVDMAHAEIDLDALAATVAADLLEQYPGTQLDIAPIGVTQGDQAMLRQVFANLIGNAIKFSSRAAQPRVEIYVAVFDGSPAICVRDNGVGFDMAHADRLFGVFQRMHGVDEFPGTGVGLAIVKRIVERHGGRIWVDASPGNGATFCFTLADFTPADALPGSPGIVRTGT